MDINEIEGFHPKDSQEAKKLNKIIRESKIPSTYWDAHSSLYLCQDTHSWILPLPLDGWGDHWGTVVKCYGGIMHNDSGPAVIYPSGLYYYHLLGLEIVPTVLMDGSVLMGFVQRISDTDSAKLPILLPLIRRVLSAQVADNILAASALC